MSLALRTSLFVGLLALPAPARAQLLLDTYVPPDVPPTQSTIPPPSGLELRALPVESRQDVADFVGRNLPGAALGPHGLLVRGGDAGDTALLIDGIRVRHL